ncbi:hypothetical protein FD03_GL001135 [Companilactobacillus nodensis DSM 19682 = JCM 14932 = NBRC 107160]|uniref:Uncharacterized protein n=1 Tax=Companilactobacillus nodensis DSM 19682 = JCM 14932 = NBRC 107160 TaxID=1423775 RepID=A0A0R1KCH5_9LACO|nr:hypothetical protein [Companilactobacillus nodensis]KRK81000.1 hypothetical protein FD03_GL001135 [Companilactobacillus nodensis DSM 19682 = JCM 14932 = NBRC 107160]
MDYLMKRIRFIIILIFSLIIFGVVQWQLSTNGNLSGAKILWVSEILKSACIGFGLYAIVMFFRVK